MEDTNVKPSTICCRVVTYGENSKMLQCWRNNKICPRNRLNPMHISFEIISPVEIFIGEVRVPDVFQCRGIGTKMLNHFIAYCRSLRFRRLTGHISTHHNVEKLRSWYERCGFVVSESTCGGMAYDICLDFEYRSDRVKASDALILAQREADSRKRALEKSD